MDKEQKKYKSLIKADLSIVANYADSDDKALRLQAAYHMLVIDYLAIERGDIIISILRLIGYLIFFELVVLINLITQ